MAESKVLLTCKWCGVIVRENRWQRHLRKCPEYAEKRKDYILSRKEERKEEREQIGNDVFDRMRRLPGSGRSNQG